MTTTALGVHGLPLLFLARRPDLFRRTVARERLSCLVVMAGLALGGIGVDLLLLLECRAPQGFGSG